MAPSSNRSRQLLSESAAQQSTSSQKEGADAEGAPDKFWLAVQNGDDQARQQLWQLVYDDLRKAAYRLMPAWNGKTLQPTALLHEVVVRFQCRPSWAGFRSVDCFFSVAVDAMHKLMIDHYRKKSALRHGGDRRREPLDAVLDHVARSNGADFGHLHEALMLLQIQSQRQYDIVRLRFFGGLTMTETADMLGVSLGTVERDWRLARAKLRSFLMDDADDAFGSAEAG